MKEREYEGNLFALVGLVRTRANQIARGSEPRVWARAGDKPVSIAIDEVLAGEVALADAWSDVTRRLP